MRSIKFVSMNEKYIVVKAHPHIWNFFLVRGTQDFLQQTRSETSFLSIEINHQMSVFSSSSFRTKCNVPNMKHGHGMLPASAMSVLQLLTAITNHLKFPAAEKEQKPMKTQKLQSTWTLQAHTDCQNLPISLSAVDMTLLPHPSKLHSQLCQAGKAPASW